MSSLEFTIECEHIIKDGKLILNTISLSSFFILNFYSCFPIKYAMTKPINKVKIDVKPFKLKEKPG